MYVCMYMCPADSDEIKEESEHLNSLWMDLKQKTNARSLALAGAKEVHTFDRDAADTRERIQVFVLLFCNHEIWQNKILVEGIQ